MNIKPRNNSDREIVMRGEFHVVIESSGALRTAQHADAYANQLRDEFNTLLFAAITKTDKRVAGRFTSLLNELCVMTGSTVNNIRKGR
ncbi:hypothetical protein [Klebsiella michiganensis]|uniref:hypothetical protein n=1 Tax=Klebsiella michiganensis TaxID=1134687 RepID=UPI0010086D8A|nr:hypothetical protein [Klebsiella michiganensis]MDK6960208.1 hypothetical protein [Klebsiella michiganensis]MDM6714920.1 hypothetical protein [Klebsiella michiganensis]MDM6914229.1 hypothetical protein [Klebsiella michiganensis]MDM6919133.1 hypothetical protein [Klebsiella michiganensis]MDM6924666.1 hypothetical protein [Klebsiella michiganensis]